MFQVVFRTDANQQIGLGHVMRSISVADSFKNYGHRVLFVIADDIVKPLIEERGYETYTLNSCYRNMEMELWQWPDVTCDIVIVDSYYVTIGYFKGLHDMLGTKLGKVVYIDDLCALPYPVDVLVNYNVYGSLGDYKDLYSGCKLPELIIGPFFTPLRSMFRDVERRIQPNKVKDILISTGGADELHLTTTMISYLLEHQYSEARVYHFLIGAMNLDREVAYKLSEGRNWIVLHENVTDMKELICSMDLAISAAGSTLYEICACGVPLITFSLSENQLLGAKAFERLQLAVDVGDLRELSSIDPNAVMSGVLKDNVAEVLLSEINALSENYGKRVSMSDKMRKMIDGYGSDRLVQELSRLCFRPA